MKINVTSVPVGMDLISIASAAGAPKDSQVPATKAVILSRFAVLPITPRPPHAPSNRTPRRKNCVACALTLSGLPVVRYRDPVPAPSISGRRTR